MIRNMTKSSLASWSFSCNFHGFDMCSTMSKPSALCCSGSVWFSLHCECSHGKRPQATFLPSWSWWAKIPTFPSFPSLSLRHDAWCRSSWHRFPASVISFLLHFPLLVVPPGKLQCICSVQDLVTPQALPAATVSSCSNWASPSGRFLPNDVVTYISSDIVQVINKWG